MGGRTEVARALGLQVIESRPYEPERCEAGIAPRSGAASDGGKGACRSQSRSPRPATQPQPWGAEEAEQVGANPCEAGEAEECGGVRTIRRPGRIRARPRPHLVWVRTARFPRAWERAARTGRARSLLRGIRDLAVPTRAQRSGRSWGAQRSQEPGFQRLPGVSLALAWSSTTATTIAAPFTIWV